MELSRELYDGQGRVTLLSQRGIIAVTSHYQNQLERPFKEAQPELAQQLESLGAGNHLWFTDSELYVVRELSLNEINARWKLVVEVPLSAALADINELLKVSDDNKTEIDGVATATEEMSATAGEVASIAATVSVQTNDINQTLQLSQEQLATTVNTVSELNQSMGEASQAISEVSLRSDEINRILTVIEGVAEQTNLLALNAAIEAARAGEAGRGFAVVADEVRSLSLRTQESTTEINSMISSLQTEVQRAVDIIETGTQQANEAIASTRQAHEELQQVVLGVGEINDNIRQVATAAEEQSSVSGEITQSLANLGNGALELAEMAVEESASSERISAQLDVLDNQLAALRTE